MKPGCYTIKKQVLKSPAGTTFVLMEDTYSIEVCEFWDGEKGECMIGPEMQCVEEEEEDDDI